MSKCLCGGWVTVAYTPEWLELQQQRDDALAARDDALEALDGAQSRIEDLEQALAAIEAARLRKQKETAV